MAVFLSQVLRPLSTASGELHARDFDVFISHASEDKDDVVRPLAEALRNGGLEVWYDEFELQIGDSLRRKIDSGLARSRFGVVVLSQDFFRKGWTNYELDGLVTRAVSGEQVLLPIWHNITKKEVIQYSPSLQAALKGTFKLSLPTPKLNLALTSLESRKMLLRLPSDNYRIPDEQRAVFEKEIAASEKVEVQAKESFCKLVTDVGAGLDPEKVWTTFENDFLGPLINQVGVNAYRLVAGEKLALDPTLVDHFLQPFPQEIHSKLCALVTTFIDPKKPEVRAFISRMLHARFCVEASGLSEEVLTKLNASVGKPIRFVMFVDTNFLFSLLELHENPSNAASEELRGLIAQLKNNPRIDLVVTPETIEEAKSSIGYTKGQLSGLPSGRNFTEAALQARFSGMARRKEQS